MNCKVFSLLIAFALIFVLSCNKNDSPVSASNIVPTAPQSLITTPGNLIATLTWQVPSNIGSSAITGYNIYRGITSGGQTFVKTVSGSALSYIDSNLTNGIKYYYYVTALNNAGESNRSNEAYAIPRPNSTVPSIPTNIYTINTNNSVTINWNPPTDNGGVPILGYKIYKGTSSNNLSLLTTIDTISPRSYVDNAVTNFTTYYYSMSAFNIVGESVRTTPIDVTPGSQDTLIYTFSNFNDSIITVNYAIGGNPTSQPVQYPVNLMKNPLNVRFNMTYITSGSMTLNLYYITSTDTIKRQPLTLNMAKDSIRNNMTGPVNRMEIVPTNFKGRGTINVYK